MTSPASETNACRIEGVPHIGNEGSPEPALFLQPAAGRILSGAGLGGGSLQQVLRHHGSAARRIVLGRQILRIVAKSSGSV